MKIMMNNGCRKIGVIAWCINSDSVPCPQIKIKKDAEDKDKDENDCPNAIFIVAHLI